MTRRAYYNDFDKDAAAWLRELIAAGLIMAGDVDERSISDVRPTDLAGYAQCHFFGGISGWPLALQLAGWPDDHPCWSGSCPCQPFSSAGKRTGITDCRHLWPEFKRLIAACCPSFVFGEQVASSEVVGSQLEAAFLVAVQEGKIARANRLAKRLAASKGFHFHPRWLDGVRADLEAEGYAFRFMVLGAHSVGAPHIRQRVYWLAHTERRSAERYGYTVGGAEGDLQGTAREQRLRLDAGNGESVVGLADAGGAGREGHRPELPRRGGEQLPAESGGGPWSDCILIPCRDGKVRRACPRIPVVAARIPRDVAALMPRLEKLGHDAAAARRIIREARRHRIVALKGAGNSIVPPLAAEFIRAAMEAMKEPA